jgi:SAM-dependent methyltransferase
MNLAEQMDRIYRDLASEEIPWNVQHPPDLLVELVESRRVLPCRAVDLGCGAGNHAVWLAARGFQVTGLDLSSAAIEAARALARQAGVSCEFAVADLLGDVEAFEALFDFAYEWEVLHHIFPEDRQRYAANVCRVLRPGSSYLSICFSEDDSSFVGTGKYRETPLGTTLYFSSEREIKELFEPLFQIERLSTIEIAGKRGPHLVVGALLTKAWPVTAGPRLRGVNDERR